MEAKAEKEVNRLLFPFKAILGNIRTYFDGNFDLTYLLMPFDSP